jgi:hypothetical protein
MEIEDLKRKFKKMDEKLGRMEQTKDTVFRVNRKVHETGAKMTQLEKGNREVMKSFAEVRTEQREENKKMRRFITERARKARNQALIVGLVALIISLITLPFVIMLVMRFWEQLRGLFGM